MENPLKNLRPPRKQQKNPRYFDDAELKKIFSHTKEPYHSIFKFLYYTGLRTGELANLEWRDYNRDLKQLTIRIVSQDKKKRLPVIS
ncbi:MAG: tyrosine-type recombinase/integrase [Fibrobacteria bacterium]|nr:tyrosine-type recombinase/integrase [Fibrobacteria bacterium]